jgi:hypothetical protein
MPTTTASSNVLKFPARTPGRIDPARRFGRPRYSSLYLLGVRLFHQTISVPITTVTRLVVDVRSRFAGRRLHRSSQELLRALDDLIVLNARAYPGNLDVVLQEIETRKRHWQVATTDISGSQRS